MGEREPGKDGKTRRSVLQSAIGLSVVSVSAVVYDRMARDPDWHSFDVEIGSNPGFVELRGTVPVSMLSSKTDNFEPVKEINRESVTVRFAIYKGSTHPSNAELFDKGTGPLHGEGHVEDVNGDGVDDFVFHFDACEAFIHEEINEGKMKGRLVIKEGWSFTEEKDGWSGDKRVRIVGRNCS